MSFLQLVMLTYYLAIEIREMCTNGISKYLRNPWNYLEIINYSMLLLSLSILIMFEYVGHQRLADNLPLYFLSTVMGIADSIYAISIVLATLKVFKYLKASERFSILIGTLENAADDILIIISLVLVLVLGFSFAFYAAFSGYLRAFSSIPQSFYTSLTAFVTADFSAFQPKITHTTGLVIVYVYIFLMSAIILSLLIAIVEESFEQSQERVKSSRLPDPLGIRMKIIRRDFGLCLKGFLRCGCAKRSQNKYRITQLEKFKGGKKKVAADYVPLLYKKRDGNLLTRRTTDQQLKHVENLLELLNDRLNELSLPVAQNRAEETHVSEAVTDIQQKDHIEQDDDSTNEEDVGSEKSYYVVHL